MSVPEEYTPKGVRVIVGEFPAAFDQQLRDDLRMILEEWPESVKGLKTGQELSIPNVGDPNASASALTPLCREVEIKVPETSTMLVNRTLTRWFELTINGRYRDDLGKSGIQLTFLELSEDGTTVINAWQQSNMFFRDTGVAPAGIKNQQGLTDPLIYKLRFFNIDDQPLYCNPNLIVALQQMWDERLASDVDDPEPTPDQGPGEPGTVHNEL